MRPTLPLLHPNQAERRRKASKGHQEKGLVDIAMVYISNPNAYTEISKTEAEWAEIELYQIALLLFSFNKAGPSVQCVSTYLELGWANLKTAHKCLKAGT